ncbi:MAG: LCP family protein [Clostridia bacterium]|nr:LCP family protein [Clostridia bacterium]
MSNSGNSDNKNGEGFFSDINTYNENNSKSDNFRVNIPVKEVMDSYNKNSYYENKKSDPRDIPIGKGYYNPHKEERYDHNAYLRAQQQKNQQAQHKQQTQHTQLKPQGSYSSATKQFGKAMKKKKSGCGCGTMFVCLLLVLAIGFAGLYGYVFAMAGKVQSAELQADYSVDLKRSDDVLNILLIGLDKADGGVSRSDSMMLLSIDKSTRTLKLTSFLRDMWVKIPGYYNAKLNAAYAYGGAQLTVDTIESNFNIDIDHFVLVDFDMFEQIIDSLGGVTVDITEREAEFLRTHTRVKVPAGENTLNGEYALIYSRIRKLDSDFYRTQRQRKVMTSIINKAKRSNPITLVNMVSDIMPLITTDINRSELTGLAFSALKYIRYDIDQLQVPADGTYSSQMISGQSALVPNMEANKTNIYNFIYNSGD